MHHVPSNKKGKGQPGSLKLPHMQGPERGPINDVKKKHLLN